MLSVQFLNHKYYYPTTRTAKQKAISLKKGIEKFAPAVAFAVDQSNPVGVESALEEMRGKLAQLKALEEPEATKWVYDFLSVLPFLFY